MFELPKEKIMCGRYYIGTQMKKTVKILLNAVLGEESYDKTKKQAEKILYVDNEKIYQYKYLPISFLT